MEPLSNNDVAPKLYDQIEKRFRGAVATDPQIKAIKKKVKNKTAELNDAWVYASRISEHASNALKHVLTPSNLPDGVLYWNIADRTVRPVIELACGMNADMYVMIQEVEWERQKIGLKPKRPNVPKERVDVFLNKLVLDWEGEGEE